jgi:hypothetical protein
MEASAGLVAGSHNRNELVVIRCDGEPGVRTRALPLLIPPRAQRNPSGVLLIPGCCCFPFLPAYCTAQAAGPAGRAGVPDLRRRRGPHPRRGALRGVQRVRLPHLPRLLRVRAAGGHTELPAVQDPVQAPQGQATPRFSDPAAGASFLSLTLFFCCRVRACSGGRGRGRRRRPGGRVQLEGQRSRLPVRRRVHAPRAHELRPRRRRAPARPPPHQRPDGTPNPATHIGSAPLRPLD